MLIMQDSSASNRVAESVAVHLPGGIFFQDWAVAAFLFRFFGPASCLWLRRIRSFTLPGDMFPNVDRIGSAA